MKKLYIVPIIVVICLGVYFHLVTDRVYNKLDEAMLTIEEVSDNYEALSEEILSDISNGYQLYLDGTKVESIEKDVLENLLWEYRYVKDEKGKALLLIPRVPVLNNTRRDFLWY